MLKRQPKNPKKTTPNKPVFFDILFFLFLFLLPTQLGKHFFFDFSFVNAVRIDYLAPTLFLTDILAVLIILSNFKKIMPIFKNKYFLIFLGFTFLNILTALSHPLAIYKSLKTLEIIFIFISFRNLVPSSKLILSAFLSSTVIQLSLTILQLFYKQSIQGIFYFLGERSFSLSTPGIAKASYQGVEMLRPYGTFSHPNSLAGFYLLLHTFVLTYKPFNKFPVLKYSLLFISATLILVSFSKLIILGFFLVTFLYTVSHQEELKCEFCMGARIVVAGILTVTFSLAQGDPLSGQIRLQLAENALEIIKNHLVAGIGLGNYLLAQSKFAMQTPYFFLQPVHNIFLLWIAETGIFFSGYLAYLFWKVRNIFINNQTLLYCAGVLIFTGMFDHYWLTLQQNLLLMSTILAFSSKRVT